MDKFVVVISCLRFVIFSDPMICLNWLYGVNGSLVVIYVDSSRYNLSVQSICLIKLCLEQRLGSYDDTLFYIQLTS